MKNNSEKKRGLQMTLVRLGYVAMSVHLKNASPSQTMTFAQFSKRSNREAAIRKLERISRSNLANCLRLLRYNVENDISFFRLSSKLIPLANHPELKDWDFFEPITAELEKIKQFLVKHPQMRVDFHPDHFVLLNSPKAEILIQTLHMLNIHRRLLEGFGLDPTHRCVLHVGGGYQNKEKALEQFIHNWGLTPSYIQSMIMLENDDKVFTVQDTLYLCEKLGIPLVFDLHHHEANNEDIHWEKNWERILATWKNSPLPIKIHISSPRSEKDFRAHADYIDPMGLQRFLEKIKGTVKQIDIMIEAKKKDEALFKLVTDIKEANQYEWVDGSTFIIK